MLALLAAVAIPGGVGTNATELQLSSLVPQRSATPAANFDDLGAPIRLVVLACKRPLALNALLTNLNSVGEAGGYEGHSVPLLISIDTPRGKLSPPDDVVALANDFVWNYGEKTIRLQETHQGILGQWLMLRTPPSSPWMAVLEDDLALSPCFYSYLLRARKVFGQREDISGFTLQKHGPCLTESEFCASRDVPMNNPYIVRCVGSWGFMPTPASWTHFIEWQAAHRNTTSPTADLPKQLVHHKWYDEFVRNGKLDSFWTVWHLAFSHAFGKGTLVAELPEPLARPHGQQPSEHGNEPDRPGNTLVTSFSSSSSSSGTAATAAAAAASASSSGATLVVTPVQPPDTARAPTPASTPTPRPASLGPLALNLKNFARGSALNLVQTTLEMTGKKSYGGRFPSQRWGEEDRARRMKAAEQRKLLAEQRKLKLEQRAKVAAQRFKHNPNPAAYDGRTELEANPDPFAALRGYEEHAAEEAREREAREREGALEREKALERALLSAQTSNVKLAKALARSGGGAELEPAESASEPSESAPLGGGPVAVPFLRSEVIVAAPAALDAHAVAAPVAAPAALSAPVAGEVAGEAAREAAGAAEAQVDGYGEEVAGEESRGCCVQDVSTLQAGGNQTCINACQPGQNCCGPCGCPGCPHHAESHVDAGGFCVVPAGAYRPPTLEELGLCTQCDAIRDPTSAFWSAEPIGFDYDGRRMEWPPAPRSTNMPSLNSSVEAIAQSNRRKLLLEAAEKNRQRRDAAMKKAFVGHASASATTGGTRHRASDGSEHVTMFSRREDGSSSSDHSSSSGSGSGSGGGGGGGISNLAKLLARGLGQEPTGPTSSSRSDGGLYGGRNRGSTAATTGATAATTGHPELLPLSPNDHWRRH